MYMYMNILSSLKYDINLVIQLIPVGQKQMTVSLGGFLPFELGEITGKFNHPLEQVHIDDDHDQDLEDHDDDLEDHDDGLFAVSVHPGAHVHETDLHNTFCLSSALGACREGESGGDDQDVQG